MAAYTAAPRPGTSGLPPAGALREHLRWMNLLLVEPEELGGDGTCVVRDHRALHLRSVIGVRAGWHVRAGVVGGGIGSAEVKADDGVAITLRLTLTEPAPLPLPIELVLAVPRPKVLSRTIEAAAAFGIARIDLTNAWRVDKGYLTSPRLQPEALARAARTGAEQGGTTWLPDIKVHRRLMALLGERWPGPPATKLIAHPGAPPIQRAFLGPPEPTVLAIGPEGGWIAREVETFQPPSGPIASTVGSGGPR